MIVQAMPYPASAAFTPASIAGLSFWYDIQDLSTLFQDTAAATPANVGDPVGRVNDKSGNGYTLLRTADAGRPILRQTGSVYYLEFDGVNDSLIHTGTNVPCGTIIVTAHISTGASGSDSDAWAGIITNRTDQASDVDFAFIRDSSTSNFFSTQASGGGLANSTHFWNNQVQTNAFTNGTQRVYSADGTGHPGTLQFPTGLSIGSDRQIAGRHLGGRIFEIVGYLPVLSQANREAVEDYMAARYTITF